MFLTASVITQLIGYAHLAALCAMDPSSTVCGREGWSSWALTEVTYRRDHPLSFLLGVSSFLPLVVVMFLSGLASAPSPRRLPTLMLLMFLVVNVGLNVALKRLLRSPRPRHPLAAHTTAHGMPSDHAQFMSFFVTYLICGDYRRRHGPIEALVLRGPTESRAPPPTATTTPLQKKDAKAAFGLPKKKAKTEERQRRKSGDAATGAPAAAALPAEGPASVLLYLFFLAVLLMVCWGRVYNGYHTIGQVAVGMVAGSLLAVLCSTGPPQQAMLFFVKHVVLEVMLVCTAWTPLIV